MKTIRIPFLVFLFSTPCFGTGQVSDLFSRNAADTTATRSLTSQHQQKDTEKVVVPDDKKKEAAFQKEAETKSPSFQKKKWTGTQGSYETNIEYDYVGRASGNMGNGTNRNVDESYFDVRHQFMRHTLLAFLVQGGVEYQRMAFGVPNNALVPDKLDNLMGLVGIDFRWSEKDLVHIEGRPGLYTDWQGSGFDAFNSPLDIGYTRVVSDRFQWVVGVSVNTWRRSRILGGAGFRWQMNNRWKLKAYMPSPSIEYVARPDLTLTFGADVRGDTYRVGPHFGSARSRPELNSALVDYQEVRVGPGFSWNIRPTIEVNMMAGYMVGRQFDFHNNAVKLNGSGAPFATLAVHALFKLPGERLSIPQSNRVSIRDVFNFL